MREALIGAAVGLILAYLLAGFALCYADPHLNLPIVSQVACTAKGDTWDGGSILILPGCYAPGAP